ncbi:hypothetical protein BO94DRAFT_581066 [Aspergillus sclerotioniger CBS 115572]|uniref:Uncharacterized protein n=1 Tax=Aspergillus sclerotioniger CBS 115572 TaxID=1450535 RepID=A0A317XGC7_9EURO|nr:hypothetical protein BO94DRAFT_581066 [Aspergillus sclerotioniger CBS 115572]PWY95910.1 hypothetical protein BO94DRAFT_581066 [Aspergillus sclerotioniger CBS 115572]
MRTTRNTAISGALSISGQSTRIRLYYGSSWGEEGSDDFPENALRVGGVSLWGLDGDIVDRLPNDTKDYEAGVSSGSGIRRTLDRHGVDVIDVQFGDRQSSLELDSDHKLNLLVRARCDDPTDQGWISLARDLHMNMLQEELREVNIKIIGSHSGQEASEFPCTPDDDIFPIWKEVAETIMKQIDLADVYSLACYRMGWSGSDDECPPTVVLGVNPRSSRNWNPPRDLILGILETFKLDCVAVHIREDSHVFADEYQRTVAVVSASDCEDGIGLGSTVGPHGSRYPHGTMGGWFELQDSITGYWVSLALTCSHCIFPHEETLSDSQLEDVESWKRGGVYLQDERARKPLYIDAPILGALQNGLAKLEYQIEDLQANKTYQNVIRANENDESVLPRKLSLWNRNRKAIMKHTKEVKAMTEFIQTGQFVFGLIFAASGRKEEPASDSPANTAPMLSIRDWALIESIRGPFAGPNYIPKWQVPESSKLVGFDFGVPKPDERLHKFGSATGVTEGVYNGLKTAIFTTRIVDGEKVTVQTWEHTILSALSDVPVAQQGDHGSLLLNKRKEVVGMIFGGASGGEIAYFTHISDIISDIKNMTGASEVRLRT